MRRPTRRSASRTPSHIFAAAKHPKSFVSLADADHLLDRRSDAVYVANVIAAWAERYLEAAPRPTDRRRCAARGGRRRKRRRAASSRPIAVGPHRLIADEPVAAGGLDTGPEPYDLLLAALGACTAMTLRLYAEHKKLPLERVSVTLTHQKIHAADCEELRDQGGQDRPHRAHDRARRATSMPHSGRRLLEIADKCPVHRTLTSEIDIRTVEADGD